MSTINIPYDGPTYYVEDAIKFIHDKTGIDEQLIEDILEAEDDYMRSIGLIVEIEEEEDGLS